MRNCCICEKTIDPEKDLFKIKLPSGIRKFICEPCKQIIRVGFETHGKMKFSKGRLAGNK
ncbi:MAG: hypothetical protein HKN33_17660 [Pyrinomonadaceae bacterium]|nr:hypothetical protein [Pyrinomonadaceae bacterium]